MAALPEHVLPRRAVVGDALTTAHRALIESGIKPDKTYYIYVPDGADAAVTRTLDPLDEEEFMNRKDIRGRPNIIVRPVNGTKDIGPAR